MSDAPEVVGVLGGTFDPVHVGHLRLADEALRTLRLSRVLLVPASAPPHKPAAELSPAHHREAMLRLALHGHPDLEVSRIELEEPRACYTIDTLRRLRDGRPPLAPVFLLGMDSLLRLPEWRSWRELISEFDLAVVERDAQDADPGPATHPEVARRLVVLSVAAPAAQVGRGGRVFRLPIAPIAAASSAIRRRSRAGLDLGGLVPPAVARYIQDMGLYRAEQRR